MSVRSVLFAAVACAGLAGCAATSDTAGCHYLNSSLSAHQRTVGGQTIICDPNLVDSTQQMPHADDYILRNRMW